MSLRHVRSIDANLLVALAALLEHENASRAARELGLTQPAVSRILARLRAHFGDPLFSRTSRGLRPTPFAESLRGDLEATLSSLGTVAQARPGFDPSTARSVFRIATADYCEVLVMPAIIRRIAAEAPGIDVNLVPLPSDFEVTLDSRSVDMIIAPIRSGPKRHQWHRLLRESLVVVMRPEHPAASSELDLASYAKQDHLLVSPEGRPGSIVDDALNEHGLRRRIAVTTTSFFGAAEIVSHSDLIAALPRRIADHYSARGTLIVRELPLKVAGFVMGLGFHLERRHDPAHEWLRDRIQSAVAA